MLYYQGKRVLYICEDCGHVFDEGDQAVWEERHGFDHGPYEKQSGCPLCRGSYRQLTEEDEEYEEYYD